MTTQNAIAHELVAKYRLLSIAAQDAFHISNAKEAEDVLNGQSPDFDVEAVRAAISQVRPLAIAALLISAFQPTGDEPSLPSFAEIERAARLAHGQNYLARGDRYAEPEEMVSHLADPLGMYELVRDRLILSHGVVVEMRGVVRWADEQEIRKAQEDLFPAPKPKPMLRAEAETEADPIRTPLSEDDRRLAGIALDSAAERWAEWSLSIAHQGVAATFARQSVEARALSTLFAESDRIVCEAEALEDDSESGSLVWGQSVGHAAG